MQARAARPPIRLMHFVYSFHMGGLENVVIQLINRLPADQYQHCLVSLTDMGDFVDRIQTRVPVRIHAEHGWDASDPKGQNVKFQRLRKLYRPFVSHYVSVSQDLDQYLGQRIGVPANRRTLIANGVDTAQFSLAPVVKVRPQGCPFEPGQHWLIGTVGRLQTVKNQPLLARAFVRLLALYPGAREHARLVIVGEGPLRAEVERIRRKPRARHAPCKKPCPAACHRSPQRWAARRMC